MTQDNYISFYDAKELLAIKLDELSDEEFWIWCFIGNENGGLNAYISEKLDNNIKWHIANTFSFPSGESIEKYAVRVRNWFFLYSDIQNFQPTKRFISGKKLLVRWKSKLGVKKEAEDLMKSYINKLPEINENIPSHPKISNYYPDLIGLGDDGLGGIYLLDEVIAFEKFTHMPKQETKTQAEAVKDVGLISNAGTETKERELVAWLRETWINEGKLGGVDFFARLKKYVNQTGSPIVEHYSAGKDAGFKWKTSAGTTGSMTKKTISNKVSIFNSKP